MFMIASTLPWKRSTPVSFLSPKGRRFLKGKPHAYQTAGRKAGSRYLGIHRHLRMSPGHPKGRAALRPTAKQSC
jgi:hypothetical protein